MPCSEKGCPFPPVPGTDRCRAHPDSPPDNPSASGAFTLGAGRWWRRQARENRTKPLPRPPLIGESARSTAQSTPANAPEAAVVPPNGNAPSLGQLQNARSIGLVVNGLTRVHIQQLLQDRDLRRIWRAAYPTPAHRRPDGPSPGQLREAVLLGIVGAHRMNRRELQEWVQTRARESRAKKQEQWLARVIERELTRRLDALLGSTSQVNFKEGVPL